MRSGVEQQPVSGHIGEHLPNVLRHHIPPAVQIGPTLAHGTEGQGTAGTDPQTEQLVFPCRAAKCGDVLVDLVVDVDLPALGTHGHDRLCAGNVANACQRIGLTAVFQDVDLGRRIRQPNKAANTTPDASALTASAASRRTILTLIPIVAARLGLKRAFGAGDRKVIRPPGADPANFNALCARCGNCMRACPYKLIHPDLGESGLDGLFTPALHLRSRNRDPEAEEYCFQDCVACTQVCPTGALRPLTVEEKHARPIGLAVVDHTKCIAWAKHEYCAVCDEYCPYQAIKLVDQNGVNCPIVDTDKCRGCGACEGACAASPIAIIVQPRSNTEIRK